MKSDAERYKFIQVLIVDSPNNINTWQALGFVYAKRDRYKQSIEHYMNQALDVIYSQYQGRLQ